MAESLSTAVCHIEEDRPVSGEQVEKKLAEFLKNKSTRNGLTDDKFSTLKRLQEALKQEVDRNSQSDR